MKARTAARLAWSLWALATLGLALITWLDYLLHRAGRPELANLSASVVPLVVAEISAATVGAVLAGRRPRHPVGWLLLGLGVLLSASGVADQYADYGLLARPGSLLGAGYAPHFFAATVWAAFACVGFVLLLTPTGSLPSRGWRWWARVAGAVPIVFLVATALASRASAPQYRAMTDNPFDFRALSGALLVASQSALAVTMLSVLVAAGSLVVRFRRAHAAEREQIKWVALAAALISVMAAVIVIASAAGLPGVVDWAAGVCVAVLPMAIGAAILRYRLYDIDFLINRTLVYGALTAVLGAAYVLIVTVAGTVLEGSDIVTAGATLAVAALFRPLRRRIQGFIDRRFYRHKYDAEQTLADFSRRLRDQIDLDTLNAELLGVVTNTVQPTHAALWLRSP